MRSSRSVNSFASVQSYTDRWRKRASSGQSGKSSSDSPAGSITSGSIHIIGSTSGQRSRQRRRISSRKQAFNARITSQMSLSRLEELYNVRPGFKPINVFRKAARLIVILVKAEIGKETVGSKQLIQFHCFCFEKRIKKQNFEKLFRIKESRNTFFVSCFESWIKNQLILCFFANLCSYAVVSVR